MTTCGNKEMMQPCLIHLHVISLVPQNTGYPVAIQEKLIEGLGFANMVDHWISASQVRPTLISLSPIPSPAPRPPPPVLCPPCPPSSVLRVLRVLRVPGPPVRLGVRLGVPIILVS